MSKLLIDVAYDVAKKEFGDKEFSFAKLWAKVKTNCRIKPAEAAEMVGDFYADLAQDARFTMCKITNDWRLTEYLSLTEKEKMRSQLYNFTNVENVYEEGYTATKKDVNEGEELLDEEEISSNDEIKAANDLGYDHELDILDDIDENYQAKLSNNDDESEEE